MGGLGFYSHVAGNVFELNVFEVDASAIKSLYCNKKKLIVMCSHYAVPALEPVISLRSLGFFMAGKILKNRDGAPAQSVL